MELRDQCLKDLQTVQFARVHRQYLEKHSRSSSCTIISNTYFFLFVAVRNIFHSDDRFLITFHPKHPFRHFFYQSQVAVLYSITLDHINSLENGSKK